jgi:hypothetical protein
MISGILSDIRYSAHFSILRIPPILLSDPFQHSIHLNPPPHPPILVFRLNNQHLTNFNIPRDSIPHPERTIFLAYFTVSIKLYLSFTHKSIPLISCLPQVHKFTTPQPFWRESDPFAFQVPIGRSWSNSRQHPALHKIK